MDRNHITKELERLVEDACAAAPDRFGIDFYTDYILLGRDYAFALARIIEADEFIIGAAALLHTLGELKARDGAEVTPTIVAGAASAELKRLELARGDLDRVMECIATCGKPVWRGEASAEAVCLSNGLAMAVIARPALWLRHAFIVRGMGYRDGCAWLLDWYERLWNGLVDEGLTISATDYRAARRVLSMATALPGTAELESLE